MKRVSILFIFITIISFTIVTAGTCSDDQTIMRLYQATNSHVSFWNEDTSDYTYEICYNDIFGTEYTGANPHECNEGSANRILSLYQVSNSHASDTTDADYNKEVCYGELKCEYDRSASNSCSNEGQIVARMYSAYNTHVSDSSDTNYNIKICCISSRSYWADTDGNEITSADFGDTVQLITTNKNSGTFEIKERDLVLDDEIKTISSISDGKDIIGTWTISQEDLDKTNDFDQFYFTTEDGLKSGYLSINQVRNDDPTVIEFASPTCGSYFDEGTDVMINVSATDNDDIINGTISINNNIIETFQNGGTVFYKTLSTPGNFQITVETTNTQGERSRISSSIMVLDKNDGKYVDGKYVAACILNPKDLSHMEESTISFDASTTRAIKITNGVLDLLIPDEGDTFNWYWKFMPENIEREIVNTADPSAYRFTAEFPIAGDNSATLRVEIN